MRTDFLQKVSTQLVHENQVIFVETLRTKNMLKNRRSSSCHFGCWFWRLPPHVGIQMQVVRKDAGQSKHVLSVVKVVLHLPPEECRTPTPRPLAVPPLQNRTSAGRKCHRKHFRRGFENLSRGTLGSRLWRHSKT